MSEEEFARADETPLGDVVAIGVLRPAVGDLVAVRSRVDATVEFDLRLTAGAAASGAWKAVVFGISRDGSPMDKFGSHGSGPRSGRFSMWTATEHQPEHPGTVRTTVWSS